MTLSEYASVRMESVKARRAVKREQERAMREAAGRLVSWQVMTPGRHDASGDKEVA